MNKGILLASVLTAAATPTVAIAQQAPPSAASTAIGLPTAGSVAGEEEARSDAGWAIDGVAPVNAIDRAIHAARVI